jgi:hypothetical protein
MMTLRTTVLAAAALMLAPLGVQAQAKDQFTYRCVGKDGRKHYGSAIPQPCVGLPVELINKSGLVVRRIDPKADEEARLAKEAEAEKRKEMEIADKETARRNQALLATYTSEKDIEEARGRALRDHKLQVQEVERRIDEIKKRQARFEKDLAVYKEAGKGAPPTRLNEEITNAAIDLKAQQSLLEAKKKEAVGINTRYDEDRRRYKEAVASASTAKRK